MKFKSKNSYLILGLLLILISQSNAQNNIDSLENVLSSATGENRVNLLNELVKQYRRTNLKKSVEYGYESNKISKKLNYLKGQMIALKEIGNTYQVNAKLDSAIYYLEKALKVAEIINTPFEEYLIKQSLGINYGGTGNYKKAGIVLSSSFYQALNLLENKKNEDPAKIVGLRKNIGWISLYLGDIFANKNYYDSAFKYYQFTIEYSKLSNDIKRQIEVNGRLSQILFKRKEFNRADKYLDSAFALSRLQKNSSSIYLIYLYKSALELEWKHFERAILYNDSAVVELKKMGEETLLAEATLMYGQIYLAQKDYIKSEQYLVNALSEIKKFNQGNSLGQVYLYTGILCYETEKYSKAKENVELALKYFKKNNDIESLQDAYKYLSKIAEKENDLKSALEFQNQKIQLLDSGSKENMATLINNLELKSEIERKKQEAEITKKESEIQKIQKTNIILISTLVLIALLIILVLVYNQYRLKNKTSKQLAELNATKDKFFTIISHDLKTPISSLNNRAEVFSDYYTDFTESEKIEHVNALKVASSSVMKLLDNLLTWSRIQTEKLKANSEIFNLNEIVDSEVLNELESANKKNIKIQSNVSDEVEVYADIEMIKAVMRNLISNAIKYTNENGKITISAIAENNFVKVSISDNGIGIKDTDKVKLFRLDVKHSTIGTSNEKGTGLGLNLCKEFIELNNGKIWFESNIEVGSTFSFTLPKVEEEIN